MTANKHWLLIAGFVVLFLIVGIGIVVYRSKRATPPAESEPPKEARGRTDAQEMAQSQVISEPGLPLAGEAGSDPDAEKLYQMAMRYKAAGSPSPDDYRLLASCCQEILERYPNTLQAERAGKLLSKARRDYWEQSEGMVIFTPTKRPEVKKSQPLRTRIMRASPLPRDAEGALEKDTLEFSPQQTSRDANDVPRVEGLVQ